MAASNSNHRGTSGGGIQLGSAWFQRKINLRPQHRGVHLVTEEILRQMPELGQFSVGLCHVQSKNFSFLPSSYFSFSRFRAFCVTSFLSLVPFLIIICNNAHSVWYSFPTFPFSRFSHSLYGVFLMLAGATHMSVYV